MSTVPLKRLGLVFLRVGNLTFGGGDPTMAALQSEVVSGRRWISEEQYALIYGLARITPGTNILAFCAAAAWLIRGWLGAMVSIFLMTLPSAAIVVLLTRGYQSSNANALAMAAIGGTLAAAVGMMMTSAWQLVAPHARRGRWLRSAVIFVCALVASMRLSTTPIEVLALAAVVGLFWHGPSDQ